MPSRVPSVGDLKRMIAGSRTEHLLAMRKHYQTSDEPLQHMDVSERDTYLRWIEAELDKRERLGHFVDTDSKDSA